MLIAISGSQGSGKSTILQTLREDNYCKVIDRKTSRSILTDWDLTLDEINSDLELTVKFQEEITKRKWDDEMDAIASKDVWFTERTHMDLFVYTLVVLGNKNKYSDWLNRYYNKCFAYTQAYTDVFYLPNKCFDVESDGVRGENTHYSTMIDCLMWKYTQDAVGDKAHRISSCDIDSRCCEIKKHFSY